MSHTASSVIKLKNNKAEWAWRYLLGIKDPIEWIWLEVGSTIHYWIELFNKWLYTTEILEKYMDTKKSVMSEEDQEKYVKEVMLSLENYFHDYKEPTGNAEIKLTSQYAWDDWLGYIDAFKGWAIIDYKTVSKFTEANSKLMTSKILKIEEYTIQAMIYVFLCESNGYVVDQVKFIEILKKDPTVKSGKKADIQTMITKEYGDVDVNMTIKDLLAKYPVRWRGTSEIVFDVTDEFRKEMYELMSDYTTEVESLKRLIK